MTRLPDYEPKQLPEGTYEFTLKQEPVKRRPSSEADFVVVKFIFKVTGKGINSARQHMESLLPWDVKYGQLLLALGAKEAKMAGCIFPNLLILLENLLLLILFTNRIKKILERNGLGLAIYAFRMRKILI